MVAGRSGPNPSYGTSCGWWVIIPRRRGILHDLFWHGGWQGNSGLGLFGFAQCGEQSGPVQPAHHSLLHRGSLLAPCIFTKIPIKMMMPTCARISGSHAGDENHVDGRIFRPRRKQWGARTLSRFITAVSAVERLFG